MKDPRLSSTVCRWTSRLATVPAPVWPGRIRQASVGLEEYSPYLDKSIEDMTYFDAGDLIAFGNAGRSLEVIGDYVGKRSTTGSSRSDSAENTSYRGRLFRRCMRSIRISF